MRRMMAGLALVTMVVGLSGAVSPASAALIFYADRAAFDAAHPGLPVEGFQNGSQDTDSFTGPLNSSTNNGFFSPGDILPGINFTDSPGPGADGMFIAGAGQSSNPTTAIGQNFPSTDSLDIELNPGVRAIAFDIFQNFGGGAQSGQDQLYAVSIFGESGLLDSVDITVPSGGAGFFGVFSDDELITRISINNSEAFDVIDNVAFGEGDGRQVPAPASLLLLGLGLSALGFTARRLSAR